MGRIGQRFEALRARGETALVPFVSAGDPDLGTTERLVVAMVEAGADLVEIGVPFSDPLAEGPTIQRSSERGLASGATLRRILEMVAKLRPRIDVPLILMGYTNPFYAMGSRGFAQAAAQVGVDGIIVPDLPPEEGREFFEACNDAGVDTVLLAAPTTTDERLEMLCRETRGFLYYVSLTGVTGARGALATGIEARVKAAQAVNGIPVCVGFGVSTPTHAAELSGYADGVVVGSAIVDRIERAADPDTAVDDVARFIEELKAPLRGRAQADRAEPGRD